LCCDVGLVSVLRLTAGCVLMDLASPAISQMTVYANGLTLQKPYIPAIFNMYLVINKCVTAVKVLNFSGHYLCNRSTLDVGVLGYIGIL